MSLFIVIVSTDLILFSGALAIGIIIGYYKIMPTKWLINTFPLTPLIFLLIGVPILFMSRWGNAQATIEKINIPTFVLGGYAVSLAIIMMSVHRIFSLWDREKTNPPDKLKTIEVVRNLKVLK